MPNWLGAVLLGLSLWILICAVDLLPDAEPTGNWSGYRKRHFKSLLVIAISTGVVIYGLNQ